VAPGKKIVFFGVGKNALSRRSVGPWGGNGTTLKKKKKKVIPYVNKVGGLFAYGTGGAPRRVAGEGDNTRLCGTCGHGAKNGHSNLKK